MGACALLHPALPACPLPRAGLQTHLCHPASAICPAQGWPSQRRRRGGRFGAGFTPGGGERGCRAASQSRAVPAAPRVPAAAWQCARPTLGARCAANRTCRGHGRHRGPSITQSLAIVCWWGDWGWGPSSSTRGTPAASPRVGVIVMGGSAQAGVPAPGALGRAAASWRVSFLLPHLRTRQLPRAAAAGCSHVTDGFLCASRPRYRCFGTCCARSCPSAPSPPGPSAMLRRKPSNASEKEPGHRKVSAGGVWLPSAPILGTHGYPSRAALHTGC